MDSVGVRVARAWVKLLSFVVDSPNLVEKARGS